MSETQSTYSTQESIIRSIKDQPQSPLECRGVISDNNYRLLMESAVLHAANEADMYDHYHALLQLSSQTSISALEGHYCELTGETKPILID